MIRHFLYSQERREFSVAALCLCALLTAPLSALQESTGPNGSNVQAVHNLGYTGQGVAVGLISQDHARYTHEAFDGHAHWYDATDQNNYVPSNHDTSVGGIICSRGGALYPNDKGTAPNSELYSFRVTRDASATDPNKLISQVWLQNALDQALDDGCRVIVTGIQLSDTANGESIWSQIYDYYAYEHNLVFATAAGNYSSRITIFGDTYNSITTAGLISTAANLYEKIGYGSNPGPSADGRQKPETAAPSQNQWLPINGDTSWRNEGTAAGQTSWAVPHTGGVVATLLSYADTTTDLDDNQNEVIKAIIVNSTFPNIQDEYGVATTGQVWNRYRGYGKIDALRAFEILSSPKILPSSTTTNSKGWAYDSIAASQQDSYIIQGIKNERLVTALAWNRRVEWNDSKWFGQQDIIEIEELKTFFANLDLKIYDPDGILISLAPSTINNLEKIDLLLTKTGSYEVRVVNQSGSESANYALAFERLEPLPADFDVNYVVDINDMADFVSYWLETDCTSELCLDRDLQPDNQIDLSDYSIFAEKWLTYDPRYYTP